MYQHASKKIPSFNVLTISSKLIYFDKNYKLLSLGNRFFVSYFNKLNVKNKIFFLGLRYMLLANK